MFLFGFTFNFVEYFKTGQKSSMITVKGFVLDGLLKEFQPYWSAWWFVGIELGKRHEWNPLT